MSTDPSKEQKAHPFRNLYWIIPLSVGLVVATYFLVQPWFVYFFRNLPKPLDWSLLGGFTSLLSLALVFGGLAFALFEYLSKEEARQRENLREEREKSKLSYDMYKTINERFTSPEEEAARRWIFKNIQVRDDKEDMAAWYDRMNATIMERNNEPEGELPEGQKSVKMALNCLDYLGFISEHYWKIEGDSLDWISGPVAKVWRRIGPYVLHMRTIGKPADYYAMAEVFANACIQWRHAKGLPAEEYVSQSL